MEVRESPLEGLVTVRGFWDGKKILVTGHTGFMGGWLTYWLKQMGASVTGFALAPATSPNLFEAASIAEGMQSVQGDVRDLSALCDAMATARPEIVFHMAAQSLVRASYREPVETFASNVMGTVNLFEAVRGVDTVRVIVNVTSDKCYENRDWVWAYREIDPVGGHDPYSASKGCAELATAAYRRSFFADKVALASARAGNVIGGGDWATDRLVADLVRAFTAGRPALIRNPAAVRPWQHVLDALAGCLLLAERLWHDGPAHAEAWNFGPGADSTVTVQELAERIVEAWGSGATALKFDAADPQPHEAMLLKLDTSKARMRLNWQPGLTLQDAVQLTVEWYHSHYSHRQSVRDVMERQISDYTDRATARGTTAVGNSSGGAGRVAHQLGQGHAKLSK